jgi:hypothetical protein
MPNEVFSHKYMLYNLVKLDEDTFVTKNNIKVLAWKLFELTFIERFIIRQNVALKFGQDSVTCRTSAVLDTNNIFDLDFCTFLSLTNI